MFELVILIVSVLGSVSLAALTLKANSKSSTNQLFGRLVAVTVVWLVTTYLALKVKAPLDIQLVRLTMALAAAQIYYLFQFVHTFPENEMTLSNNWRLASQIGGFIVAAVALSPFMFTAIKDGQTIPGPGIVAFLLFAATHVGGALYILTRKLIKSTGILRSQLKFLTLGIVISFGLIALTNFGLVVLTGNAAVVNLTPLYALILLGFVAYAILAYHLFDIRLVISRAIIYSGILGITMAVYGGTLLLLSNLFDAGASRNLITSLITALFLGFSFEPIRGWISEKTDNWLYKKEYEQQEVTKLLSEKLSTALGLDEGLDVVMQTLADTLHLDKAVTYVFQNAEVGKRAVKRSRQIGYSDPRKLELSEKDFLVQFFTQHKDILSLEQLERQLAEEADLISKDRKNRGSFRLSSEFLREHAVKQAILRKLKDLDAAVAVPLHLQV